MRYVLIKKNYNFKNRLITTIKMRVAIIVE